MRRVSTVRLSLFLLLLAAGLALSLSSPRKSEAARIKLGPLEVETDDDKPGGGRPEAGDGRQEAGGEKGAKQAEKDSAKEPVEGDEETAKPGPKHKVVSESPKPRKFVGKKGPVYKAKLTDVVDLGIAPFLDRVLEDAKNAGAVVFILEIDTPGGRVDAAVQMKDVLLRSPVPTVAFINKQAISAGALIAYAHDYIFWSTGSTMGAATPIQLGGGGEAEPVGEKMVSYMRGVMRATAEAKGRDGFVAESMVDAEIDLPGFAPKGKLLTATDKQADDLGLLDGQAQSLEELLVALGLEGREIIEPEVNWAESVARFFTHPIVSSILMSLGMLGILIELYTPGFGVAGIAGICALIIFFAGHMVIHLAGIEAILLFLAGIILFGLEIFLTPGFGIFGVGGMLALVAAFILALSGVQFDVPWFMDRLTDAVAQFSAAIVLTAVGMFAAVRYLPKVRPVRSLILTETLEEAEAGAVTGVPEGSLVGQTGDALTRLAPGGKARIAGRKMDVVSRDEFLEAGTTVRVIEVDGPSVVVRSVDEEA
jgi:membrane-bound serine protease (ClpP class)